MILSLLAAAFLRGKVQVNPPGTSVFPTQAAFYSATGGTAVVEVRDASGLTVPLVDAGGVKYAAVTVSLPAATAVGLGWELTQTAPGDTNPILKVGSSQYSFLVKMNCSATESPVGTYDSSAGAGNGIATGYPPPGPTSPTVFATGVTYTIGFGSVITTASAGGANASLANQPLAPDPLSVSLIDLGGLGDTVAASYFDAAGAVIPLVDSNGVAWSSITLTIGPRQVRGLSYLVMNAAPDGSHLIAALPLGASSVHLAVLSGNAGAPTLGISTGGLTSGAAGTSLNGCIPGCSPTTSVPDRWYVSDTGSWGRH